MKNQSSKYLNTSTIILSFFNFLFWVIITANYFFARDTIPIIFWSILTLSGLFLILFLGLIFNIKFSSWYGYILAILTILLSLADQVGILDMISLILATLLLVSLIILSISRR